MLHSQPSLVITHLGQRLAGSAKPRGAFYFSPPIILLSETLCKKKEQPHRVRRGVDWMPCWFLALPTNLFLFSVKLVKAPRANRQLVLLCLIEIFRLC